MKSTAFALFFISVSAFAADSSFNGVWRGKGSLTLDETTTLTCPDTSLTVSQSQDRLMLTTIYNCTDYGVLQNDVEFEVRGNDLFSGENKVGTVGVTELQFDQIQKDEFSKIRNAMNIKMSGSNLIVHEINRYSNIQGYTTVTESHATLTK